MKISPSLPADLLALPNLQVESVKVRVEVFFQRCCPVAVVLWPQGGHAPLLGVQVDGHGQFKGMTVASNEDAPTHDRKVAVDDARVAVYRHEGRLLGLTCHKRDGLSLAGPSVESLAIYGALAPMALISANVHGPFLGGYRDADGLPVADRAAKSLGAIVWGKLAKERTPDHLAQLVHGMSSADIELLDRHVRACRHNTGWIAQHEARGLAGTEELAAVLRDRQPGSETRLPIMRVSREGREFSFYATPSEGRPGPQVIRVQELRDFKGTMLEAECPLGSVTEWEAEAAPGLSPLQAVRQAASAIFPRWPDVPATYPSPSLWVINAFDRGEDRLTPFETLEAAVTAYRGTPCKQLPRLERAGSVLAAVERLGDLYESRVYDRQVARAIQTAPAVPQHLNGVQLVQSLPQVRVAISADPEPALTLTHILPAIDNAIDFLEDRLAHITPDLAMRVQEARAALMQLRQLPGLPDFEQPKGATIQGFTVGHVAQLKGQQTVGLIVEVSEAPALQRMRLQFAHPQVGAAATADVPFSAVGATWPLDASKVLRQVGSLIEDMWAIPTDAMGRHAVRIVNDIRTATVAYEHGQEAAGGLLPERLEPAYAIRHAQDNWLYACYHSRALATQALDDLDADDPLTFFVEHSGGAFATGERLLGITGEALLRQRGEDPSAFFRERDQLVFGPSLAHVIERYDFGENRSAQGMTSWERTSPFAWRRQLLLTSGSAATPGQPVTLHVVFHPGSTNVHDAIVYDAQRRVVGAGLSDEPSHRPQVHEAEHDAEVPSL